MTETAAAPGAPSDVLMALYMGDRERATALAGSITLTLPELAAFGDLGSVTRHVTAHPGDIAVFSPDGWTALHLAGYFGYDAVVVRLIRAGAELAVHSRNAQGNTPLHATLAGRGSMAAVAALLAAGADPGAVDAQGVTPLHLAAARGEQAMAALLLACGADRSVRMPDGKTAAAYADERGHTDLAAWLHSAP